MRDRNAAFRSQQHEYRLGAEAHRLQAADFFDVLTGPQLLEKAEGLRPPSARTGAYSRARQRLPIEMVAALTHKVGGLLCARASTGWRWRGRVVKLSDGTGTSIQDTPENQRGYPQPSSPAKGAGFPLMRLTGVIRLSTGVALNVAMGPHSGQ